MNWDNGLEPWLCGRLVGWVRARAYVRTVLRETPNWRAISRMGRPWILACCTAFQSANCRWVQLPACRRGSFSTATGRLDRTLVDRLEFQVGQLSQLGLAETMVTQAFHDAVEFRGGSHGPVRGSQHTGSRRCLPAGDDFALIAYLETAVGVFQDFHLHSAA